MNKRVRVFDRPDGRGLVGVITQVEEDSFRFITDSGRDYVFPTTGKLAVQVQFLDGDY